jgi:hypothetical protein
MSTLVLTVDGSGFAAVINKEEKLPIADKPPLHTTPAIRA